MALSEENFEALFQAAYGATEESLARNALSYVLENFRGRVAVISSFGAESAVLLALVAGYDTDVPVYFLDTLRHFPETLAYRSRLTQYLGLTNPRTLLPKAEALIQRDPQDQLYAFDPDACCALRKVEPLDEILPSFDLWITGRKRMQAATRTALPVVERQEDGRVKLNPLAGWSAVQIRRVMEEAQLPVHPLVVEGYRSIGCAPCTLPVCDGDDDRAGRWAGFVKTECGLHRPVPSPSTPQT